MTPLKFTRPDIPLWTGGEGELVIDLAQLKPLAPIPDSARDLLVINFNVGTTDPIKIGGIGNLKLGIKAGTVANLAAIRKGENGDLTKLLADSGLGTYFDDPANTQNLLMALRIGASADASLSGPFQYSVLSATTTLDAGGRSGYTCIRPFPKTDAAGQIIRDLITSIRMPSDVTQPLQPGEVIGYGFGGYLNLGVGLTAGFEMCGTKEFGIGTLDLSEYYNLSVLGKLRMSASVAGEFSVQVRGTGRDKWVQVVVRRDDSNGLTIAADVSVETQGELEGLPSNGREFLGAALGVNVQNWFNVLNKLQEYDSFEEIEQKVGTLANDFVKTYVDKAFSAIPPSFEQFLGRVNALIDTYNNIDQSAIALLDRYFDRLDLLAEKLREIKNLISFNDIQGEVASDLWDILRVLTDGDPLGFSLGTILDRSGVLVNSIDELKKRAQDALDLVQEEAHNEIRSIITLAKSQFALDGFLKQLGAMDITIDSLRGVANQRIGGFIERLIGKTFAELKNNSVAKEAVSSLNAFLKEEKTFEQRFNTLLKEAAKHSISTKLHAEYNRADETRELIDVDINLDSSRGIELMKAAGRGDFTEILANVAPDLVRINEGVLSHSLTRQSAFRINIIGWHTNWKYSGFDKVVTETAQRIKVDPSGSLAVFTTLGMKSEKESKRNNERVYSNFVLRFIGESKGAIQKDPKRLGYLVDAITSMSSTYQVNLTDDKTEPKEFEDYLSFAADLGLADRGASMDQLRPLLTLVDNEHFGKIEADYRVSFTAEGLTRLFAGGAVPEPVIRQTMRKLVLANYLRNGPHLGDIAWCYAQQEVHNFKVKDDADADGTLFANRNSLTVSDLVSPIPGIVPPSRVALSENAHIRVLDILICIEDKTVDALLSLQKLINSGIAISPLEFEKQLQSLGDALKLWDKFDEGPNSIFALLDRLIDFPVVGDHSNHNSALSLVQTVGGISTTKMFVRTAPTEVVATAGSNSGIQEGV